MAIGTAGVRQLRSAYENACPGLEAVFRNLDLYPNGDLYYEVSWFASSGEEVAHHQRVLREHPNQEFDLYVDATRVSEKFRGSGISANILEAEKRLLQQFSNHPDNRLTTIAGGQFDPKGKREESGKAVWGILGFDYAGHKAYDGIRKKFYCLHRTEAPEKRLNTAGVLRESIPTWASNHYKNSAMGRAIRKAISTFEHPWQFVKFEIKGDHGLVAVGKEFFTDLKLEDDDNPAWCAVFFVNRSDFEGKTQQEEYRNRVLAKRKPEVLDKAKPGIKELQARFEFIAADDPLGVERGGLLWYLAQREGPKPAEEYVELVKRAPIAMKKEALSLLSKYYHLDRKLLLETARLALKENPPKEYAEADPQRRFHWRLRREAYRIRYACGINPDTLKKELQKPTELSLTRKAFL